MEEEDEKGGKNVTAILQIDMHCSCEGCSERVSKCVHDLQDLNSSMKIEESGEVYKVRMTGKFDPSKLRQKMEKRLKKTVKLISPKLDKEETEIEQMYKCNEVIHVTHWNGTEISTLFSGEILHRDHFSQMPKAFFLFLREFNRFE